MTELPEEEAWKEHSCKSGCGNNYSITDLGQAKVHFVAGWNAHEKAVASFLETARKQREAELLSLRNELRRELKKEICDCDGEACIRNLVGGIELLCKDCENCSKINAVLGEESGRKCFNCNKKLEKWLDNNKDADGNEYCADCVAKVELIAEQEEDGGEGK